ncbi:MAG TPA: DUF1264 domain-containing protein [Candidatus Nanoarchaeia archaeon]|nr:DUF1264 domain-containing protein [Candidatus Nanoarchaeia archaeon]
MKPNLALFLLGTLFILAACTQLPNSLRPTEGYTIHIAATKHAHTTPELYVHHYCKGLPNGVTQCQLYDSDTVNARLIGVEFMVPNEVFEMFNESEKKYWHAHQEELKMVQLKAPEMSEVELENLKEALGKTHGKVIILWDPTREYPDSKPRITDVYGFK